MTAFRFCAGRLLSRDAGLRRPRLGARRCMLNPSLLTASWVARVAIKSAPEKSSSGERFSRKMPRSKSGHSDSLISPAIERSRSRGIECASRLFQPLTTFPRSTSATTNCMAFKRPRETRNWPCSRALRCRCGVGFSVLLPPPAIKSYRTKLRRMLPKISSA